MNYCDNVFSQKKNISMFSQGKTPHCILTAWKTHETELRHWLQRQLSDHEQAADALHDIFLKMIAQGTSFCYIENPRAWLFQVARNHLVDVYRRDKHLIPLPESIESELTSYTSTEGSIVDDLTQCLPRVLSELSEEDRNIIKCCDIEGMSLQQYATDNQLTLSATKSRVQRARKRLRDQMILKCQVKIDESGAVCCFTPR